MHQGAGISDDRVSLAEVHLRGPRRPAQLGEPVAGGPVRLFPAFDPALDRRIGPLEVMLGDQPVNTRFAVWRCLRGMPSSATSQSVMIPANTSAFERVGDTGGPGE